MIIRLLFLTTKRKKDYLKLYKNGFLASVNARNVSLKKLFGAGLFSKQSNELIE